jgi:serine/threonine-protein kinase
VYKGVDTNTGYLVAVKVLWSNISHTDVMQERFRQEANHYIYLDHPNIVKLKDFIQKDNTCFLVMEYLEGQTLENYINHVTGPIPETQAIHIILHVLAGVQYAHENHVLHLDLKPSNIMITKEGNIKLIDFGISVKFLEANKGHIMGSPLYMSPEQTEGGAQIDTRSDIYSLGITFFQMLTGTTPLQGNMSRNELFEKIRKGALPRAKTFYPFVSDQLQEIIDKATRINKKDRYQKATELADALNNVLR